MERTRKRVNQIDEAKIAEAVLAEVERVYPSGVYLVSVVIRERENSPPRVIPICQRKGDRLL